MVYAAMKILDPHLCDGVHEWRDGIRFVKEGDKLCLEGTDTLAGRFVLKSHEPFAFQANCEVVWSP
jgi:N-acetylglucosamine-6-phosphate deacetylase